MTVGSPPTASPLIPRCPILGVQVSAIDLPQAVAAIGGWIAAGRQTYVCVTGVHGVMECQRDARLKGMHNAAGMVTPDGMPLVWLSRRRGFPEVQRVYGPDLLLAVCQAGLHHGYRHYFYGGGDAVPQRLASRLQDRFPTLQVAGAFSPPFRRLSPQEDQAAIARINASAPDLLWVGLSTPKQERWMAEHLGQVQAPVMIGVGAAFDFHAGLKRQAPRWMQRSGLEWLFRLASEPRRLAKRYLTNNPLFVGCVLLEALGVKNFQP